MGSTNCSALSYMIVAPVTPVVTSLGAYPTFNYHVAGYDGKLQTVPYSNNHEDPDAILAAAAAHDSPLMHFANPDNPMGNWYSASDVQSLIDSVPRASSWCWTWPMSNSRQNQQPPIDTSDPRVIRMRTFSKAHGMAGARIGYAIVHCNIITGINKIRLHFTVKRIAQMGAVRSLHDHEHITEVVAEVARGRQEYYDLATRLQLPYVPSATNFVSIDVSLGYRARALVQKLAKNSVFIRMPGAPRLDQCVRVTVGTSADRALFSDAFKDALDAVPA